MEIIKIPLEQLTPDPHNAKDHPQWQIEQIKNSIEQFGNLDPIGVWGDDNLIVEGHGRYEALKDLGYHEAECIRLDWLTEEERRAYALTHNQLTMNSGWNEDYLQMNLEEIGSIDMSQFGFEINVPDGNGEPVEDNFEPVVPEEPNAKHGQIWQLGDHRLMCGDATLLSDVEQLLDGCVVDLVVTDPPYNMGYEGAGNTKDRESKRIMNDKMSDEKFERFLYDVYVNYAATMRDGASIYVFYKELGTGVFIKKMVEAGLTFKQELIWVKNQLVLGGSKYQSMYEPCLMGCKGKRIGKWNGKRKQRSVMETVDFMSEGELRDAVKELLSLTETDVLRERKQLVNDLHPTMKPIRLLARLIQNSSDRGDAVMDLFGGSGSTMIACEQLGRRSYLMELDPKFCDVIVQRWESFTGGKAVLLNG